MDKLDFDYPLTPEHIAQAPLARRRDSRLLVLDRTSGAIADRLFVDIATLIRPGDLLVFNDTRVLAARLHGHKASGGAVQVMLERVLDTATISAKIRANKPPHAGSTIHIGEFTLQVTVREGELYTLMLNNDASVHALLDTHGHIPLPPYIRRDDTDADRARYQTVWARHDGAVAAPTAGLHFDEAMLATLTDAGVDLGYATLHVGSGTYQRLREGDVETQRLHAERVVVDARLCAQVDAARSRGGRVIAVGTTVIRSLESAARASTSDSITTALAPFAGETELFMKPGDDFRIVDAVLTNFHEPQSSLLMLISAFAGRDAVLDAYRHALAGDYRFLSYGDAMFIA